MTHARTLPSARARTTIGFVSIVVLALCLLLPSAGAAQIEDRYALAGDEVAIYNLLGSAKVVRGEGSAVEVKVALGGPDAGKLEVATGRIDGRETLRVLYAGEKLIDRSLGKGSRSEFRVAEDGTFGDTDRGGRKITIASDGTGIEAHADLTILVPAGKRVHVHQAAGELSASAVSADLFLDAITAAVTASEIRGSLSIDVASGSVAASAIDGNLTIDTGSGEIDVKDVSGERVMLDTGSGTVSAVEITAPRLSIDTGSGGIHLTGVTARVIALDSGSGSISAALESDVETLSVDTGSGSVRVAMPEAAGADIRIETGSGDIAVDAPHETIRAEDNFFHGSLGDGDGEIVIETGSGDVTIESNR